LNGSEPIDRRQGGARRKRAPVEKVMFWLLNNDIRVCRFVGQVRW
jgi:hypothetical protein